MEITVGSRGKKSGPGGLFFVGIIFLVIGLFTSSIIDDVLEDVKDAQNWPQTTGTVEGSAVHESGESDSGNPMYSFSILVSYEVDGVKYSTRQMDPMGGISSTSSRRSVQKKVDAYPKGAQVPVYYKPEDPSFGVLKTKLPLLLRLPLKLPLLAILLGIFLIIRGILSLVKLGLGLGFLFHKTRKEKGAAFQETVYNPPSPSQESQGQKEPLQQASHQEGVAPEAFIRDEVVKEKPTENKPSNDDGFSI